MKKTLVAAVLALGSVGVLSLTHNLASAQEQKPKVSYEIQVVSIGTGQDLARDGWQCVGALPPGNGFQERLVMQRQK